MSKEYELAFKLNAELDAKFSRVFTNASDRLISLEKQIRGLDRVGSSGTKFGSGIVSGLESMTRAAARYSKYAIGGLAVGGVAAAGYAVKSSLDKAMEFEEEMSTIQALTSSTNEEMSKYQALALKMGADTKYSAMEAATAIEELLKAGMQPATVQAGGLSAALNLATAGGLDLAEAAATMATSLNAFKKDGMTADRVSNILAGTANAAATDVHELSYAIAQGGSVANMAGLAFLDFNTAIGLMSNDGLKSGSDAGTSFKSMLMYLQPQTKQATKLFNQLGIGVGKANKFFNKGKIKDIAGIAEVLHDAFDGFDEQTRTAKMLDMFGTDGVKAASALYKAGAKGVKEFQKEMQNVTALDVAKKKMDNAAGAVEQFKGAIETLQISALLPTMPILKNFANSAADLVTKYTPQITAGVQRGIDTARDFLNSHYLKNPEFTNLPTISQKIGFVFDDALETFNRWYDSGGNDQIAAGANKATGIMINAFEESAPRILEVGIDLGGKLGVGILRGVGEALTDPKNLEKLGSAASFISKVSNWTNPLGAINNVIGMGSDYAFDHFNKSDKDSPEMNAFWDKQREGVAKSPSTTVNPKLIDGSTKIEYKPNITIQGNADKATVEQVTKAGSDNFAQFIKQQSAWMKRVSLVQ